MGRPPGVGAGGGTRNPTGPAVTPAAGGTGLSRQDKVKLLWGKKKEEQAAAVVERGAGAGGANRWDAAQFGSEVAKSKFSRLMGVKSVPTVSLPPGEHSDQGEAAPGEGASTMPGLPPSRQVMAREDEVRVMASLEQGFMSGLHRGKAGIGAREVPQGARGGAGPQGVMHPRRPASVVGALPAAAVPREQQPPLPFPAHIHHSTAPPHEHDGRPPSGQQVVPPMLAGLGGDSPYSPSASD